MSLLDKTKANLAFNVRVGRAISSMTQEALADAAKLQRSQISLIERGDANPSLETLCKVAEALETTLADLLSVPRHRSDLT